jgi:hypothetical protein
MASCSVQPRHRRSEARRIEISELDANASPKAQFTGYRADSATRPEVAFHLQSAKESGRWNKENSAERLARPG